MGYCIDYAATGAKKVTAVEKRGYLRTFAGLFFLLGTVLVWNFWPEGREVLERLFIPGDPAVTVAAAESLVTDLRGGVDTQEAVTAFCREIISGGN